MCKELELIQIAVGTKNSFSKTPSPSEWEELVSFALEHSILGLFYPSLEKLPEEQRPSDINLMKWYGYSNIVLQKNKILNLRSEQISKHFEKGGFPTLILKGQANARFYPHPEYRSSGDIDICVDGDRDEIVKFVKEHSHVERVQFHHVDYHYFDDTEVEVHFMPMILFNYFSNKRLQSLFEKYRQVDYSNKITTNDGYSFNGLTNIPNLMMQMVHLHRHLLCGGISFKQMFDYYYLLKSANLGYFEKEELKEVVSGCKLRKFAGALMYVLSNVFALDKELLIMEPNEKEGRFLLEEIMSLSSSTREKQRQDDAKYSQNKVTNFFYKTYHNVHVASHYPSDFFWNIIYRISQELWRIRKGY